MTYITTCFNVSGTLPFADKVIACLKGFLRIIQLFPNTALIGPVCNGGVVWSLWGRNWTLIILSKNFRLQPRCHTAKFRVHPVTGLWEMCVRRGDIGTGFSQSTPISPCRYHWTNAPCSSSFHSLVRSTSGRNLVVFMQNSVLSNIREHWKVTHFHIVVRGCTFNHSQIACLWLSGLQSGPQCNDDVRNLNSGNECEPKYHNHVSRFPFLPIVSPWCRLNLRL